MEEHARLALRTGIYSDMGHPNHAMSQNKQQHEDLKNAESLANAVIENAGALVVVLNSEGRIVRFNRRCEQISGYTFEEVNGKFPWDTVLPPEDADEIRRYAFEALANNPQSLEGNYTNHWQSHNGDKHLIEWSNTLLFNEHGQMHHMVSVGTDITERWQTDDELRIKNTAIDSSFTPIALAGLDGRVTYANRAFVELWQLADEHAAIGRSTTDFWERPEEARVVVEALSKEGQWQGELSAVRDDGSTMALQLSAHMVTGDSGNPLCMMASFQDISEHKRTERVLLNNQVQLNEAQRLAKMGSWSLDLRSNTLEWSDETFRLFELDKTQFTASYEAFLQAIHPDDRDRVDQAYTESLKNRRPYEISHRIRLADGRIKHVHESCETLYDEQGSPVLSRGTIQDITRRKLSEDTINLYANVFRHSAEAILITDHNNHIIAINPALTALTGYTQDELLGKNPNILSSGLTPAESYEGMWQSLSDIGHWQGEMTDRRKDGGVYPKWATISVIRDDEGKVTNYIASFTDISERKEAEERIYHLAHHDTLTGLYNRFSLEERLGQALSQSRRESTQLAVMFIDLDRFKVINDTLGHHVGDAILIEVARRLQECVRKSDIVARLGGDEFVVVMTNIDETRVVASMAAKIVNQLNALYSVAEHELRSSPSIGVSLFPTDGDDVDGLMKNADTAMYHAKAEGRNNYQFFTRGLNEASHEYLELERDLRGALEQQQFELYYQPKVEAKSGRVSGVEALIRWNHPQRGVVSPDKFIPIAEETGLIEALGSWVFETACSQLAAWRQLGITSVKMAVNLSPRQLRDPRLVENLKNTMATHHICEGDLELEVTETAAMANAEHAIQQMNAIRTVGAGLAIDDFGTGYSSLSYLKLFPIQTLKLDRTFVRDIETDENDAAICIATISLAHNLGMKVVAEGVETEAQQAFLSSHQCDTLQGYLFSRPAPAAEITEYLKLHATG